MRPRQTPERLSAALERAHREGVLTRIDLGALSLAEARAFLGESLDATETAALYEESGGNPFYLQELARKLELAPGPRPLLPSCRWPSGSRPESPPR